MQGTPEGVHLLFSFKNFHITIQSQKWSGGNSCPEYIKDTHKEIRKSQSTQQKNGPKT